MRRARHHKLALARSGIHPSGPVAFDRLRRIKRPAADHGGRTSCRARALRVSSPPSRRPMQFWTASQYPPMCRSVAAGEVISRPAPPCNRPVPQVAGPPRRAAPAARGVQRDDRRLGWTGRTAPVAIYDAGLPGMKASRRQLLRRLTSTRAATSSVFLLRCDGRRHAGGCTEGCRRGLDRWSGGRAKVDRTTGVSTVADKHRPGGRAPSAGDWAERSTLSTFLSVADRGRELLTTRV